MLKSDELVASLKDGKATFVDYSATEMSKGDLMMKAKWKIIFATIVCLALLIGILAALKFSWAIALVNIATTLLLVSVLIALIARVFAAIESVL